MYSESSLSNLVNRLESCISKLEAYQSTNQPLPQITSIISNTVLPLDNLAFFARKIIRQLCDVILAAKDLPNNEFTVLSYIIAEAVCAHQDILISSPSFQRPNQSDMTKLNLKLTSITSRANDRIKLDEELVLPVKCVMNGFEMFDWLWTDKDCDQITRLNYETIDLPANKILAKKNQQETKWIKGFKAVMKEINDFVEKNHKKGLTWASSKGDTDISNLILRIGNTYRENFRNSGNIIPQIDVEKNMNVILKEISSGDIKSHLKPIQIDDKRSIATYSTSAFSSESKPGLRKRLLGKGQHAHVEEKNNVYSYENFDGEIKNINSDTLTIKTILQVSNCLRCTFKVSQRINRILISNCEDLKIICDSLLSNIEIINSTRIKVQCNGLVNMFNIDGCKDVLLHLSAESANMPAYIIHSTEVKIRVVHQDIHGTDTDYTDYIIPEQFVFRVNESNKLESKVSEIYNSC